MSTNSTVKETGPKGGGRIVWMSRLVIPEGKYSDGLSQDKRQNIKLRRCTMRQHYKVFLFQN